MELLVAMSVFSLMIVMMLGMTNSLLGHASRIDANTQIERDVRIFFDLLRRDLAQARIGKQQIFFRGESNKMFFATSSPKLSTNHVSDIRLVTYQLTPDNQIIRSVIEPTMSNYSAGVWSPTNTWWTNSSTTNANFSEVILEGVIPYTNSGTTYPFFTYIARSTGMTIGAPTQTTNPPAGVVVAFGVQSSKSLQRGSTNLSDRRDFRYDIELNLPPIFDP